MKWTFEKLAQELERLYFRLYDGQITENQYDQHRKELFVLAGWTEDEYTLESYGQVRIV